MGFDAAPETCGGNVAAGSSLICSLRRRTNSVSASGPATSALSSLRASPAVAKADESSIAKPASEMAADRQRKSPAIGTLLRAVVRRSIDIRIGNDLMLDDEFRLAARPV